MFADDEDAEVIKYRALDTISLKYHLEEEQLKHALYVNFILPNQQEETQPGEGEFANLHEGNEGNQDDMIG